MSELPTLLLAIFVTFVVGLFVGMNASQASLQSDCLRMGTTRIDSTVFSCSPKVRQENQQQGERE